MSTDKPSFKAGVDAQTITKFLEEIPVGAIATYEEISRLINDDIQANRGPMETARRILLRENQIVFGAVHGIGLKRLDATEIVEQEQGTVIKVRRATTRAMKRLASADFDSLPPPEQGRHRLVSATLGAIAVCSGKKAQNKLSQRIQNSGKLEVGEAFRLFESSIQ